MAFGLVSSFPYWGSAGIIAGVFMILLGTLTDIERDLAFVGIAVIAFVLLAFCILDLSLGLQHAGREVFRTSAASSGTIDHSSTISSSQDQESELVESLQPSHMSITESATSAPPPGRTEATGKEAQAARSAMPPYVYSSLRDDEIRLVHILATTVDSTTTELYCEIITVPLSAAPDQVYVALSYNWGDDVTDDEKRTIIAGGKAMQVRPNLYSILQRIRDCDRRLNALPSGNLLIWVDAICINQADSVERGRQVLRMQAIYASATLALSVVDLEAADASKVLQLTRLAEPALTLNNQRPELRKLIQETSSMSALRQLCCHQYWTRVWILQEFAIGQPLRLLINNSTVGLELLELILEMIPRRKLRLPGSHPLQTMLATRKSWQNGTRMSLLSLLLQMPAFSCSERIDRVFGVLGLVHDDMSFLREPSYTIGFEDWTILMTKSYARKHSLNIIFAGAGAHRIVGKIPSWCPDYFHFDKNRPSSRQIRLSQLVQTDVPRTEHRRHTPLTEMVWHATGNVPQQADFTDRSLHSVVRRLGTICSLGATWSYRQDSSFPKHSEDYAQNCKLDNIVDVALHLCLASCYQGESLAVSKPGPFPSFISLNSIYVHTHIFHTRLGKLPSDDEVAGDFAGWICANRRFYANGAYLESHAERVGHPFVWYWNVLVKVFSQEGTLNCVRRSFSLLWSHVRYLLNLATIQDRIDPSSFVQLERAASSGMRLMCMNNVSFGVGWAAPSAELDDEVFLVPGCSVPVILRWNPTIDSYLFVGDAIIVGAMKGEIWEATGPEDLIKIEIK